MAKSSSRKACVKRGLAYERKVARELARWNLTLNMPGEFHHSQWINFYDENGRGWAQPDVYFVWDELILLIECKLTQTDAAEDQLLGLYLPLLKYIYGGRHIVCVQACRNLRYTPKRRVLHPNELLIKPRTGVHVWHWLGN